MNNLEVDSPDMIDVLPAEYYDYSDAKLLGVISHLVKNTRTLANQLDATRPDVAKALDLVLDGIKTPNIEFEIDDVHEAGVVGGIVIALDRITNKFMVVDTNENQLIAENKAMTNKEILKTIEKLK